MPQRRVFCPIHTIGFLPARDSGLIACRTGAHPLGEIGSHPYWGYCAECHYYWPLSDLSIHPQSWFSSCVAQCPACRRPFSWQALCEHCAILYSSEQEVVPPHEWAEPEKAPLPRCPGCECCFETPRQRHDCPVLQIELTTAREVCPFCHVPPRDGPGFPIPVALYADELRRQTVTLAESASEVEQVRVPVKNQADLQLAVIRKDSNPWTSHLLVPVEPNLAEAGEVSLYEQFFDCRHCVAGTLWILKPALVQIHLIPEEWQTRQSHSFQVVEKGMLWTPTVRPDQPDEVHPPGTLADLGKTKPLTPPPKPVAAPRLSGETGGMLAVPKSKPDEVRLVLRFIQLVLGKYELRTYAVLAFLLVAVLVLLAFLAVIVLQNPSALGRVNQ